MIEFVRCDDAGEGLRDQILFSPLRTPASGGLHSDYNEPHIIANEGHNSLLRLISDHGTNPTYDHANGGNGLAKYISPEITRNKESRLTSESVS